MDSSFSVFEYLYRDAGNHKAWGSILLSGTVSNSDANVLRDCLESREFFVAEQVGIPTLYAALWKLSDGPTEEDHAYHEFVDFRSATKQETASLQLWGDASQLLKVFRAVSRRWSCSLSPHCDL
jgi:hypothetical protein